MVVVVVAVVAVVVVVVVVVVTIIITIMCGRDISDTGNHNRRDVMLNESKIYMVEHLVPMNDLQEECQEVVTKYTPVTQAISKGDIKK